ncbi:MAG: hypothetical protein KKB50_00865 [Planctomycetes bacterium]|nr:hypothetical protein [Planctomycetota bacterium]
MCGRPPAWFFFLLGLATYCPVSAFAAHPGQHLGLEISITDDEVVYDIVLSAELRNMICLNGVSSFRYSAEDARFHFVDEEEAALTQIAFDEFFKQNNAVTIDGIVVKPLLRTIEFVPYLQPGVTDDPLEYPPDAHVVLAYPTKGRPTQVALVWDLYPQDPSRAAFGLDPAVEVTAELDAYDENKIIVFLADEPEIIWHAPGGPLRRRISPAVAAVEPATLRVPVLSLTLIGLGGAAVLVLRRARVWQRIRWVAWGAGLLTLLAALLLYNVGVADVPVPWAETVALPTPVEAIDLFTALHRNVYRAFDYKTEDDIYDVLAQSVDGELLDQVYNEVYQSLVLRDQGGAIARVQAVDILGAEVASTGVIAEAQTAAFRIRSRWQVHGAVYHWGHVHSRTNEYKALYTIARRGPNWKIVGVDDVEQRRIAKESDDPPIAPRAVPGEEY